MYLNSINVLNTRFAMSLAGNATPPDHPDNWKVMDITNNITLTNIGMVVNFYTTSIVGFATSESSGFGTL